MAGMEDLFECHVCLERMVLKEPRLLWCHHGFCTTCLQEIMKGNKITCPTCRKNTPIESGDVTALPIDFRLLKTWEVFEKQSQPDKSTSTPNCQVCNKDTAQSKCEKCNRIFCQFCETKHARVKIYKDHEIFDLCLKHTDSITHVCEKCNELVCTTCMLTEHGEHSEHCIEYAQAVLKIKDTLLTLKNDVLEERRKVQKRKCKAEKELKGFDRVVIQLKDRMTFHHTKAEEIKKLIEMINNDIITEKKTEKQRYDAAEIVSQDTDEMLEKAMHIKGKQLFKFAETVKEKCHIAINEMSTSVQCRKEPFLKENNLSKVCTIPSWIIEPIQYSIISERELQNLTQILNLDMEQYRLSYPGQISKFSETSIAVTARDRVLVFDIEGKQLTQFVPESRNGELVGGFCTRDKVYILMKSRIIEMCRNSKEVQEYVTGLTSMSKLHLREDGLVILSDSTVHAYQPITRKLEKVKSGNCACGLYSITCIGSEQTSKQAICSSENAFGSGNGNRLYLFDERWNMVTETASNGKADGQLNYPHAIAASSEENFIIADTLNNRISLFSNDCKFLRQVLTSKDGINRPVALCHNSPYLWILERDSQLLKCFKEN